MLLEHTLISQLNVLRPASENPPLVTTTDVTLKPLHLNLYVTRVVPSATYLCTLCVDFFDCQSTPNEK